MNEYQPGNPVILRMLQSGSFDTAITEDILNDVDLNAPIYDERGYITTYLNEAVCSSNLQAVKYLFDHGANPNYNDEDLSCCPLWELQFLYDESTETQYEIEKLFFKYGADPNLVCEGEGLYDAVVYSVYNDLPSHKAERKHLLQFYKLLVLYGGGGLENGYGKPSIENIDINCADDYHIELYRCDDGYHITGWLVDKGGNKIAEL